MSRAGGVEEGLEEKKPSVEWAGAILVNASGEFLLNLHDATKAFYPNLWDLIGGTLEAGETPKECMLREILEETAEPLSEVEWLGDFDVPTTDGEFARLHLFLGEIDKPASALVLREGQAHQFFAAAELEAIEVVAGTKAALIEYVALREAVSGGRALDESSPQRRLPRLAAAMARNDNRSPGPFP